MDGLPVEVELDSAQSIKWVPGQWLVYEDITGDVRARSAGPGHIRFFVDREDSGDYMMCQFVVRYDDDGIWRYGTSLVMNGNLFEQNELSKTKR